MDPRIAARRAQVGRATQRASLRTLARVLVVLAGMALVVWYVYSPFVDIDDIAIGGAVEADVGAALEAVGVEPGDPLWLAPTRRLETTLQNDPWIATARVSRIIPGTLEVSIVEHVAVLAVERPDGTALLALDGTVLEVVPTRPEDVPVYLDGPVVPAPGVMISDSFLVGTLSFLEEFGPLSPLARFELVSDELWLRLPTHDVRLGRPVDMAAKAASLRALLASSPQEGTVIVLIAPERPTVQPPTTTTIPADAAGDAAGDAGGDDAGEEEGESAGGGAGGTDEG